MRVKFRQTGPTAEGRADRPGERRDEAAERDR